MIHFSLCNGMGLRICDTCKRNVEHYTDAEIAVQRNRIKPVTDTARCSDWQQLPRRAVDSTHGRL